MLSGSEPYPKPSSELRVPVWEVKADFCQKALEIRESIEASLKNPFWCNNIFKARFLTARAMARCKQPVPESEIQGRGHRL